MEGTDNKNIEAEGSALGAVRPGLTFKVNAYIKNLDDLNILLDEAKKKREALAATLRDINDFNIEIGTKIVSVSGSLPREGGPSDR